MKDLNFESALQPTLASRIMVRLRATIQASLCEEYQLWQPRSNHSFAPCFKPLQSQNETIIPKKESRSRI